MRRSFLLLIALFTMAGGLLAPPAAAAKGDGTVFAYGDAIHHGSTEGTPLTQRLVGLAAQPTGSGYWEVAQDGGIFTYGTARFHGSTGDIRLNSPIVGIASTRTGNGYWMVAADGGIFNYGDATFLGSMGGTRLARPVVGMAATPSGNGYWLVAADGGMFAFGDAAFHGSAAGQRLGRPIVGMAATPDGGGYWLVSGDGSVYAFGNAEYHGNAPGREAVTGIAPHGRTGYWLVDESGAVFTFGTAPFHGSASGAIAAGRVAVGIASTATGNGYWILAGEAPPLIIGSFGSAVANMQAKLDALGYWVPVDGRFGPTTTQALYALQKAAGIARTGQFDGATARALDAQVLPTARSTEGYVFEVNKSTQLLMMVSNGRVVRVFNTSTGNGKPYNDDGRRAIAVTPEGSFKIYNQINGLRISSLGELWRPKYFTGGYAIHGSPSIPPYPASHGCVRLSNAAINWLWDTNSLPMGTPVLVYS